MFDTNTPEPIPGDWQEPAPRKENKIARDLKKAEFGMGMKMYQSIQQRHAGNPQRQTNEFFDKFKIPSGTGRARAASLETIRAYRNRTLSFLAILKKLNMKVTNLHEIPDGHPKLLHLWPVKLLQAGRGDYGDSVVTAMRDAASFSR